MTESMKKIENNLNPPILLQKGLTLEQFSDYLADVTLEDANEATKLFLIP